MSKRCATLVLVTAVIIGLIAFGNPCAAAPAANGLKAWFKADTLGLSDGSAVSAWADSSGNGNDLSQSNAAQQPIFKTNALNGIAAVRFNGTLGGVHSFLTSSDNASLASTEFSIFIVMSSHGDQPMWGSVAYMAPTSSWDNNGVSVGWMENYMSTSHNMCFPGVPVSSSLGHQDQDSATWWHSWESGVMEFDLGSQASDIMSYRNGVASNKTVNLTGEPGDFTAASRGIALGGRPDYSGSDFAGYVCEVLIYDHKVSQEERYQTGTYLGGKYGIDVVPEPSGILALLGGLVGLSQITRRRINR